jgi:hypothetical protein
MRRSLLISVLLLSACQRGEKAAVAQDTVGSSPTQPIDSTVASPKRDSAEFGLFLDSVEVLQKRIDSLGTNRAAAALLFRLGQMKRYADRWTHYGGPGWDYAAGLRDREYYADEPNAQFAYNGKEWRQLIQMFPDDSLADDAAWGLANPNVGGDCEGDITCYLGLRFEPMLEFLRKYPHSNFDSTAVATANSALTSLLSDIPDLRVRDTSSDDPDYDPAAVESALARYDSVAASLSPPLQSAVRAVTGPLWVRLGKPGQH